MIYLVMYIILCLSHYTRCDRNLVVFNPKLPPSTVLLCVDLGEVFTKLLDVVKYSPATEFAYTLC